MSKKTLVAYFSASGVTREAAKKLADKADADLFEIKPTVPYTVEDLDWRNSKSRSSVEMKNPKIRPEIGEKLDNMDEYSTVYLGFPIWWYIAPTIVNSFLESYDLSGKTVVLFATSGSSNLGKTADALKESAKGCKLISGGMLNGATERDIKHLIDAAQ